MTGIQCPYCGQGHPPVSRFCPLTGQALAPPAPPAMGHAATVAAHAAPAPHPGAYQPAPRSPGPEAASYAAAPPQGSTGAPGVVPAGSASAQAKPIGALLAAAFDLYQKNLVALVATCAVLLLPVALVHAGVTALILAPTTVAARTVTNDSARVTQTAAQRLRRDVEEAQRDPAKAQQLQQDEQKQIRDMSRALATETAAVGSLAAIALGFVVAMLSIAMLYGAAVPLVTAPLTILVLDRATGGTLGPAEAYRRLWSRLPALLSATIPAFLLVLAGLCFLLIPGLVLGVLFVFVTPVVMLENVGGIAALRRSATLVKASVLQVLVMGLVFAVLRVAASIAVGIVVPHTTFFARSLVQDVLLLFLLPMPIVGVVLVYLDVRRQTEGLDERRIRQALTA